MTIVEFLLARIAEDEAWAGHCEGLHWEWRGNELDDLVTPEPLLEEYIDGEFCSLRSVEEFPYEGLPMSGPRFLISSAEETTSAAAGHIARWDPARVLAECEAKRAIMGLHGYEWMGADDAAGKGCEHDYEGWPCPTLRALAAVYADHPDYRAEWAL